MGEEGPSIKSEQRGREGERERERERWALTHNSQLKIE